LEVKTGREKNPGKADTYKKQSAEALSQMMA
jgi:hypothetical protein